MKIRIGKKLFEFSEEELDSMYIDEGMEGTIYRFNDDALKIYCDFPRKDRLNEDEAYKLSKIKTDRILLPKDLIYDENNKFIGYSTKFIENIDFKNASYLSVYDFCNEMDLVYKDLKLLNDKGVDVEDYSLYNLLFDGSIYFIDPGSHRFVNDDGLLHRDNRYRLNEFLVWNLIPYMTDMSRAKRNKFRREIDLSDEFVDFMRYESLEDESVKSFIKRITR